MRREVHSAAARTTPSRSVALASALSYSGLRSSNSARNASGSRASGSAAARDALPGLVGRRLEVHRERVRGERGSRSPRSERSSAELDDAERPAGEDVGGCLLLAPPELRLAVPFEDLRDGLAGPLLDDLVDRDERPAQPLRDERAERRLPRAHETDEGEVLRLARGRPRDPLRGSGVRADEVDERVAAELPGPHGRAPRPRRPRRRRRTPRQPGRRCARRAPRPAHPTRGRPRRSGA